VGRVEPVYGRGGGKDLAEAGALFAGDLAGPKARVLVQLALGAGLDVAEALAAEAGRGIGSNRGKGGSTCPY
jgi:L-asparaginase